MPIATAVPSVGKLIQDRMHAADLNQSELSRAMRVSHVTIHNLVNSKYRVTARMAQKLAIHLGETAVWWMDRQRDADLAKVDLQREAAK